MDVVILFEMADDFFVVELYELNVEDAVAVEVLLAALKVEDFAAVVESLNELKLEGFVAGFDKVKVEEMSLLPPLLAR